MTIELTVTYRHRWAQAGFGLRSWQQPEYERKLCAVSRHTVRALYVGPLVFWVRW